MEANFMKPKQRDKKVSPMPTISDKQRLEVAVRAYALCRYGIFGAEIYPNPDIPMACLLLAVYAYHLEGKPLEKKRAGGLTGTLDVKTGRKYIKLAEQMGLIKTQKASWDKRLNLLMPTPEFEIAARNSIDIVSEIFLEVLRSRSSKKNKSSSFRQHFGDPLDLSRRLKEIQPYMAVDYQFAKIKTRLKNVK